VGVPPGTDSGPDVGDAAYHAHAGFVAQLVARTGAAVSDGSGDYALAFATHPEVLRTAERRGAIARYAALPNDKASPLFVAAAEATEEAVLNALTMATTIESRIGGKRAVGRALPLDRVLALRGG